MFNVRINNAPIYIENCPHCEQFIEYSSHICINCGRNVYEDYNFCPQCGKYIEKIVRCKFCGKEITEHDIASHDLEDNEDVKDEEDYIP